MEDISLYEGAKANLNPIGRFRVWNNVKKNYDGVEIHDVYIQNFILISFHLSYQIDVVKILK